MRVHRQCTGLLVATAALLLVSPAAEGDVVAVVSVNSPVRALTRTQVADLFLGRASRYPNGEPAVPIDQAEGSRAFVEFYEKIAGKSPAQVKAYWSKIIFTGRGQPPKAVSNDGEVTKRITENPNAIGYIDEKLVDDSVRVLF